MIKLYRDEAKILYEIFKTDDKSQLINIARIYSDARETHHHYIESLLSSEDYFAYQCIESYYEVIEGTADYISQQILEHLGDSETLLKYYDSILNNDKIGYKKFYESGMAICILLDKLEVDWKTDFYQNKKTQYEILKDYLEAL